MGPPHLLLASVVQVAEVNQLLQQHCHVIHDGLARWGQRLRLGQARGQHLQMMPWVFTAHSE